MWTATTCCDGVSVCSTRGCTGVFTLWTSHRHGDQDWPSALWSMPSDHSSCKMAQNWTVAHSLWKLRHSAADRVVRVCWNRVSLVWRFKLSCDTYKSDEAMRGPCLLFSKVMLHYLKVFVFVIGCWTVNTGYLSSRATAHWEILVRFLWCFIICILLMCFQKYQLPDGMWSGKEQPARELQLLLFSIFSTPSVSLSLLVSLSQSLSLSLCLSVPL